MIIANVWRLLRQRATAVALILVATLWAPAGVAQTVTYFHNDVSGTPLVATDASGAVVWKESYRPYGSKWNNAPGSNANAIGYAGRPHDANTGLSYMGARYYDPVLGRFMAVDPVSPQPDELHSLNRYAYANNNPYKFVDPDGRQAARIVFRAGIFAIGAIYYAFQPQDKKTEMLASLQRALDSIAKSESGDASSGNPGAGPDTPKDKASTLSPGPNAGDSIPARGPGRDFTPEERGQVNDIGNEAGCHTCGKRDPGTKSGNWVPDHQPPNGLNPDNVPQRLYPQCLNCSRTQGGQVRGATSAK